MRDEHARCREQLHDLQIYVSRLQREIQEGARVKAVYQQEDYGYNVLPVIRVEHTGDGFVVYVR